MKTLQLLLAALLLSSIAQAKSDTKALELLNKTQTAIESAGQVSADFTAAYSDQSSPTASLSGTIYLSGKKLYVNSSQIKYWFDGTTLWTYLIGSDEVNISTPNEQEQQAINPYFFTNLYKQGYDLSLEAEQIVGGTGCYTVRLTSTSTSTQRIREMVVNIDKQTSLPKRIRFRNSRNTWITISINACHTHQSFKPSLFQFDKTQYPNVEIIDLR